ncbi:hypothetical protein BKE38_05695 [Pseudoroseomonas deserti]|uniref:Uncharacterized protein n=1 Tax=Teichococcus deserti TaxID=1817963 RepID=A0A1V2H627_9PROT|nr:hypothetical protein [Pseudoroseomonas deserti]ONG56529.1 hypothetical protein BKE38_05695 [Pseudoroseomonas deserti]
MPDATLTTGLVAHLDLSDRRGLTEALDDLVEQAWEPGWAPYALRRLVGLCARLRSDNDITGWAEACALLRAHPVQRLMLEDPLIAESQGAFGPVAASGPCAAVLDLLLEHEQSAGLVGRLSRAGRDLFTATTELGYPAALRAQTRFLARIVDGMAERRPQLEVLTLGAQHLREAGLVTASHAVARWVAQESEAETLGRLRRGLPPGLPVRGLRCGLAYFVRRPYLRGCFDLIMVPEMPAAPTPEALVDAAFAALKPGGVLLLGSAAEAPVEAAWMEAYLGWQPHWRKAEEMEALLAVPPARDLARAQVFHSLDARRVYARLERRR